MTKTKKAFLMTAGALTGFGVWHWLTRKRAHSGGVMEFEFGQSRQAEAFSGRHPDFWQAFESLMKVSDKCFGRTCHYKNRAEDICFSLGQTCRNDYLEIVFLAVHGFNVGAMKLMRGLYERAVVRAYIIKNPEKVMRFIRFGAIQDYKAMRGALETGVSQEDFNATMTSENSVEKITERRNEVKAEFEATACDVCGMETPVSWEKLSVGATAPRK